MLGSILGLGFAAFFAADTVVVRRGTQRVSVNYIATLTVFSGPIFFFLLALITGDLFKISHFTWQATLFFAISGVVHFALGRTFGYSATKILGANRSSTILGMYAVVSVILAIIVLDERLTPFIIAGSLMSLLGPLVITAKESGRTKRAEAKINPDVNTLDKKTLYLGMFLGVVAAMLWGSSAIFIKLGTDAGGTPIAGSLIAYCAASLVISMSLLNKKNRQEIFRWDWPSLRIALMSGMSTNLAQMLRYMAFDYGSVIVVSIVSRTVPAWTMLLSYIFNRKLESFSRWVFLGNGLLIAGTLLVML